MSKKFYQSIPQNAGAVARQWRYGLAATAERCDDSIRTLKFPLDGAEVEWTGASQLHSVVSGNGRGSLIGFLYAMMLGGFRVFGKQSASESFRNQASLDNASWTAGVCASSPLTVAKGTFIPSVIYQRLLVAPRSVGGKDSSFRSETIAIEYAKTFCAGKHGENVPEPERVLFNAIGVAIANTFGSWKDVVSSPSDAAGVIDEVIKTLQYPIPKRTLKQRIGAIKACEPAGTVAYDRSVAPVEASSGIEANLIVALALRAGRSDGLSDKKELTRFSQEYLTGDANHGGLAWLYGKGLVDYFTKVTTEQCIADFDIPPERAFFVDIALDAARSIPSASTTLFGGKNYASYRMGIGGLLGSWIANYITRLFDLEVALSAPPDPLTLPVALLADERMFAEIDVLPQEIEALCQKALDERGVALGCLQRLMGTGNATASAQDIETIEAYNSLLSTLEGLLSALKDRVAKARAIAVASKDDVALDNLKSYEFKVPGWIAKLDRLNRLDLSPVDPQAVLDKASEEFTVLHSAMFDHYERIQNWAHSTGETLSALQRQSLRERGYLHNTRSRRDPDEYAVRSCLEMIGRSARKCSEPTLRKVVGFFARHEVFTELSHCNQYFFNRRGTLYKSPFDKNPRQPFAITVRSVEHASGILIAYSAFLKELRVEVMSDAVLSHQRVSDLYRLERGHFAMQLVGFPEEIPARLALPEVLEEVFNLPLPIKLRLGAVTVSSAVMRKIFNHYYVRLEHLVALLLRERFFVRAKFQRSGDNALLYVPSGEQLWSAPARLYDTGKPIGEAMRRLEESHGSRGPIDAPLAMAFLCDSTESMNDTSIRAYLRQAPHDWHFPWPGQTSATGLMYDKDNGFAKRPVKVSTCRMVGSPAFKGVLDTMVTHPELVTTGDAAVLVDQHFSQETIKSSSGRIITRISPEKAVVNLAIPVRLAKPQKAAPSFSRYVGIDLGERGIGFAVFDATTNLLVESGRVKVHSMYRLAKDDQIGKRKVSATNKFRAAYDPAEERHRENVVGDFCNAINRLMWYYDAFPVLEFAAGGASHAVDKVYQAVAEHYLYSTTPTVDSVRKSYWVGASYWKHPHIKQFKFDKNTGKKSKTVDALSLFPGTGVSSYGTSQQCSCCNRNPVEAVREMVTASGAKNPVFKIEQHGTVILSNGAISLHFAAPEDSRAGSRARNQRTPLSQPARQAEIQGDDLIRAIRRNLRRAPVSRQAHDTTVSQYHCLYQDCGKVIHADINAGINIATKFASERPGM